jgi:mRNA interferase MazF
MPAGLRPCVRGWKAVADAARRQAIDDAVVAGYERMPPTPFRARGERGVAAGGHRRGALVSSIDRGEIWWGELPEAGRRPFLVMSRSGAIPPLTMVLVAPVTRTVRGVPAELALGSDDGMPVDCAAAFDGLRVVPKANLTERICALGPAQLAGACLALRNAVGC